MISRQPREDGDTGPLCAIMLAGFFFLLLVTGGSTSNYSEQPELWDDQSNETSRKNSTDNKDCSYQAILRHLNLSNKELFSLVRPVKHYKVSTQVYLQMAVYGILDVREIDQTFVPYIWIFMAWENDHIEWDPADFCNLSSIVVPTGLLWKPDLVIEEMTEKDKAPPSPYLTIKAYGRVELRYDLLLVSTCRMQVYKFPFDIQSCSLSFKSAVYSNEEIQFEAILDHRAITNWSLEMMRTQYEWQFLSITVQEKTVNNIIYNQSMIVYTITMKRRSALYIVNFLLPIMFFFGLDLATFLISDSGGEKLGFQVTVLLAVTVMQLLLNDILPSTSDRIPLIAVYCIGIFGLMMLSLLETILVMYLLDKDSQEEEADEDRSLSEDGRDNLGKTNGHDCCGELKKWTPCASVCDVSADEPSSELLSVAKEGNSSTLTEDSNAFEKISDELKEVEKTLSQLISSRKPGYWARVTKTINKVFFVCYITVTTLFLVVIVFIWTVAKDE